MEKKRCSWCGGSEKMTSYHDNEWGRPTHDDCTLYEYLFLEAMQCGLSWNLMIEKREIFRACFAGFDYRRVARFNREDVERIMAYPGMIRSERKILAMINNAQRFSQIAEEFGSFSRYLWDFCGGKPLLYSSHRSGAVPAKNDLSERLAKDLKKRVFKYLGPVTVYSYLQAAGVINDHARDCFCHREILNNFECVVIDE